MKRIDHRAVATRMPCVSLARAGAGGIAFLVLLASGPAVIGDGCCPPPLPAAVAEAPPSDSIYQLDSTWTDAEGRDVAFGELRGAVRIVAMFFSSCTYACPMLVAELKAIRQKLPDEAPIVFTLFSFDPARDTPEALRRFVQRQGIGAPAWRVFGTNTDDAARELAAVLGVNYRREPDGGIAHSNPIVLVDAEGRIAYRLRGLNENTDAFVAAATRLVRAP